MTPNVNGSLPIHYAAQQGSLETVQRLLNLISIPIGESKVVVIQQHLLVLGASRRSILEFAIQSANVELVRFLVELNLDLLSGLSVSSLIDRIPPTHPDVISYLITAVISHLNSNQARSIFLEWGYRITFSIAEEKVMVDVVMIVPEFAIAMMWKQIRDQNVDRFEFNFNLFQSVSTADGILNLINQKYSTDCDPPKSCLEKAFEMAQMEILGRLIPLFLELAEDPFYRGVIYSQIVNSNIFHALASTAQDERLFFLTIQLVDRVVKPGTGLKMLGTSDHIGYRPIHRALHNSYPCSLEFLIWLGFGIEPFPYTRAELTIFSCLEIKAILMAIGEIEFDGTFDVQPYRNRIYFSRSLTSRLLHFLHFV